MNSMFQLVELLQQNPTAMQKLSGLGNLPREKSVEKLNLFEQEYNLKLDPKDFLNAGSERTDAVKGADILGIISIILTIFSILNSGSTNRPIHNGTNRFH